MKLRNMSYSDKLKDGTVARRKTKKLYAVWSDFRGVLRKLPLTSDKRAAASLAAKIEQLNSLASAREPIPTDLTRWIESAPPHVIERLAEWGIIPTERVSAVKPLGGHVDDWETSMMASTVPAHAKLQASRVRRANAACGFNFWGEISASRLEAWLDQARKDTPTKRGISASSRNHYLVAYKSFCNWMIEDRRASESPIRHLSKVHEDGDRRHKRRALTTPEFAYLIQAAYNGPVHGNIEGPERAVIYQLAAQTGFRSKELRSLTPAAFFLPVTDGAEPTITISGAYSKNKRTDTLPLTPGMVALLRPLIALRMPHASLFNLNKSTKTAELLQADAARGRAAYIADAQFQEERERRQQSSFLVQRDGAGLVIDFHALRHTFISNLAAGNVHPKVAQEMARHGSIELTMQTYTHVARSTHADAITMLPALPSGNTQRHRATGTDGIIDSPKTLSPSFAPSPDSRRFAASLGDAAATRVDCLDDPDKPRFLNENAVETDQGLLAELADATDSKSDADFAQVFPQQNDVICEVATLPPSLSPVCNGNFEQIIGLDGRPSLYVETLELLDVYKSFQRDVVVAGDDGDREATADLIGQLIAYARGGMHLAALARAQRSRIAILEASLQSVTGLLDGAHEPRDAPLDSDAQSPITRVPDSSGPRGAVEAKLLDVLKDLEWLEDAAGPLTTCPSCQAKHFTGEPSTHDPDCQIAEALAMAEGGQR